MTEEQFRKEYGKIKYRKSIDARHPVCGISIHDINRSLMIKFKYGNISESEEIAFHEAIKKIIYRVMHKNNVMMDWDDVYQEIWKKITNCKHTWKEWKGTMVSTWITIVANSVINTLRHNVNRRNARYCLYDDIIPEDEDHDDRQENCDTITYASNCESMEDAGIKKMIRSELICEFASSLDPAERHVYKAMLSMQDSILDAYDHRLKIPINELRRITGYDEATFSMIVYNIRRKYCGVFGTKLSNGDDDEGITMYLF